MSVSATPSTDQKLQQVERSLAALTDRVRGAALRNRVIGLILLAILCGYFVWGYGKIKQLTEPQYLVPYAGQMLDESIPQVRDSVNDYVATSAPQLAEQMSTAAIDAAPVIRQSMEDYVLAQTSQAIDHVTTLSEDHLRNVLRENRAEMQTMLKQLSADQQYTDETVALFRSALEKELGRSMKADAEEVLGTLIGLKDKLQQLSAGKNLTQEEALERTTLMTIRYLQLKESDANFEQRMKDRRPVAVPETEPASDEKEKPSDDSKNAPTGKPGAA